ncbi:MAG: hypothetical protein GC190_00900 [Alphaproteobacteria bacterium]|nr:hypothetical protein [Alphaproteobacteria bacterium]
MSLDSTLFLGIRAAPSEVQLHLVNTGLFTRIDDINGLKRVVADGCIVTIFPDAGMHDDPREAGLQVNMRLSLACTESAKSKAWTLATVRAVVSLLRAMPGDVLLLYSGDTPALMRKHGRLMLDKRCGLWRSDVEPKVLPLVTLQYD